MKDFIGMPSFPVTGKPEPTSPPTLAKMKERYFQLFQFWSTSRWFPRLYFRSTYLLISYVLPAIRESKPCLREGVCVCVCCLCQERKSTQKRENFSLKPIVMGTICFVTSLWLIIINNFENFLLDFGKLFEIGISLAPECWWCLYMVILYWQFVLIYTDFELAWRSQQICNSVSLGELSLEWEHWFQGSVAER